MLETILVAAIVVLDQWTKHLTDVRLSPLGTSVPLWENVFHFTSAHNTGAAFGMLKGGRWAFLAVTILACGVIIYGTVKYRKRMHLLLRICLAMILAGAIGNLIDRTLLGYVRDMLDFRLINFAIFNVADSAVSIGTVLLALDLFFGKSKVLYEEWDKVIADKRGVKTEEQKAASELAAGQLRKDSEESNETP